LEIAVLFFNTDSVDDLPVFEETFCNPTDIPLEPWHGHIKILLKDESLRRGRLLQLYPSDPNDFGGKRGYR
jgi:hypothetical protein